MPYRLTDKTDKKENFGDPIKEIPNPLSPEVILQERIVKDITCKTYTEKLSWWEKRTINKIVKQISTKLKNSNVLLNDYRRIEISDTTKLVFRAVWQFNEAGWEISCPSINFSSFRKPEDFYAMLLQHVVDKGRNVNSIYPWCLDFRPKKPKTE